MFEVTPSTWLDSDGPATEAMAAGTPRRVGAFRFYFDDEHWEWSPEVADIHGYQAAPMSPTTDQVLAHKHPDDRHQVATTLNYIRRHRSAFSTRHRIVDTRGREHHVLVAGAELRDGSGAVVGTHGFYVDLTADSAAEQVRISEGIAAIAGRRAVIEQAKGVLMVVYGIDAATAFEVMRWRSQLTNTKLRCLAEQLMSDFQNACTQGLAERSSFGRLLMTVHERVEPHA
ncbi:MAG: PAS and ANTAR domain-containing protein [Mycolicibacterium sp.]|uniref:PAS and ANTAR domain-containing protein n=1 Tax=Mycolicibacterium sp. TaxID=2320850 RepID=UPI003D0F2AEE